jgi:hypothetical protein
MATIANMTMDELKKLVEETVDQRLTQLLGEPDDDERLIWDEIRASVDRHRWTPPPGAKSSLEFLREDRDR